MKKNTSQNYFNIAYKKEFNGERTLKKRISNINTGNENQNISLYQINTTPSFDGKKMINKNIISYFKAYPSSNRDLVSYSNVDLNSTFNSKSKAQTSRKNVRNVDLKTINKNRYDVSPTIKSNFRLLTEKSNRNINIINNKEELIELRKNGNGTKSNSKNNFYLKQINNIQNKRSNQNESNYDTVSEINKHITKQTEFLEFQDKIINDYSNNRRKSINNKNNKSNQKLYKNINKLDDKSVDNLKKQNEKLKAEIKANRDKINNIFNEKQNYENPFLKAQDNIKLNNLYNNLKKKYNKEITYLKNIINQNNIEIEKKIKQIENLTSEINEKNKEILKSKQEISNLNKIINEKKIEIVKNKKEITKLNNEKNIEIEKNINLNSEINKKNIEINQYKENLKKLNDELNSNKINIEEIEKLKKGRDYLLNDNINKSEIIKKMKNDIKLISMNLNTNSINKEVKSILNSYNSNFMDKNDEEIPKNIYTSQDDRELQATYEQFIINLNNK